MGYRPRVRTRKYAGGGLPIVALLMTCYCLVQETRGDGNVGCLFSPDLCAGYEWCFDDYAFGRCLPLYGHVDEDFLYRRELGPTELQALESQMTRLFAEGFRWSHAYTQCVMQASLRAVQLGDELEEEPATECEPLAERDLELSHQPVAPEPALLEAAAAAAAAATEEELEGGEIPPMPPLDPQDLAFVRFTPSENNPHADFADELYYPPLDRTHLPERPTSSIRAELRALERPLVLGIASGSAVKKDNINNKGPRIFSAFFNTPDSFRHGVESRDRLRTSSSAPVTQEEVPVIPVKSQPAYTEGGLVFVQAPSGPSSQIDLEVADEAPQEKGEMLGGATAADEEEARLEAILEEYGPGGGLDLGFKRPERLDVKKPGPPFLTNSYAFRDDSNEVPLLRSHQERALSGQGSMTGQGHFASSPNDLPPLQKVAPGNTATSLAPPRAGSPEEVPPSKGGVYDTNELPDMDRKPSPPRRRPPPPPQPPPLPEEDDHDLDLVDPSYAYVGFKHSVRSWKQGVDVVNLLADLLHLDRSDLTNVRVDVNEVTFKVEEPNVQGLNASEVARQVDGLKHKLKEILGVEVTTAGIGDKTKLPTMSEVGGTSEAERRLMVVSLLACGVLAAGAVAAAALLLIRRHARSREKLSQLSQPDNEASKDYQDLCRARMAAKSQQGEKGGDGATGQAQRVANLSRESEGNNSPSSRSSTSSWSEEPALTNMDISTGHMVLSYMEDHLHNKGRLEQEWVALCAYEAEPCATTIASLPDNSKKNRYPEVLPYDHARVVLNALANASGSDYINASSITDHDPRNPAYIATQGPLASTAADFWQMVWEQGSVVMVMLTRLNEGGTALCHRYWPEEGSELYHVYEVHLVSEHIWCDDYLVRSFYLKNVKTGETRTVTQFHFLSWPEGGVPTSTKALLEFRRKVNKSYRGRSCPIVVHCSDGAGRTGTYCLMDMVLNRMSKGAKEIDIAATLEHIRDQRAGMVRTKQQFELVLMAVAEEVHAILKALPQ